MITPAEPSPLAARHPFAFRDYRALWIARLCATIAQNCLVVVIAWQVYDLSRLTMGTKEAAFQLGLIGLVQFLPLLALVLVTGWTADRVDRRVITRATTALQCACAATLGWLTWSGGIGVGALFGVAALLGVARAFSMPALSALAPNLVPIEVLPRAIAMNSIAGRTGAIIGPAAGGYLYAMGAPAPYVASAVLLVVSIACMFLIKPVARATIAGARNPWTQMTDGLRYVLGHKLVFGAMTLDLFAVLLGGATALLPIYARDILHVGPAGLGHLRAAPALGSVLTALWFSYRPLRTNVGIKMFSSVGVFGIATVVFGLSRDVTLSLVALIVLGGADMFSVYVRQSLVQLYTPDVMRGRVGAVSSLFISASNELGEAESGFLAAVIGPVAAVVAGGAGSVAIVFLWARWFPALRNARTFDVPPMPPTQN